MDTHIVDCSSGEAVTVPMSPDQASSLQQTQTEAQARQQAAQDAIAAVQVQRVADAQTLLSVLPTQEARDALTRLLGL